MAEKLKLVFWIEDEARNILANSEKSQMFIEYSDEAISAAVALPALLAEVERLKKTPDDRPLVEADVTGLVDAVNRVTAAREKITDHLQAAGFCVARSLFPSVADYLRSKAP
jgi:Glu-tRNA(Gln) amidotransferase subunit E-like FAD-binding protein